MTLSHRCGLLRPERLVDVRKLCSNPLEPLDDFDCVGVVHGGDLR
jgi:hypothetical protein